MFRTLSRFIGLLALAMAVITAVLDLTRSIANSAITITALGLEWREFHVPSLNGFQVGIQRHLNAPWIWDYLVVPILLTPSWVVFMVFAIIFLWMGRRKDRRWKQRFGS